MGVAPPPPARGRIWRAAAKLRRGKSFGMWSSLSAEDVVFESG